MRIVMFMPGLDAGALGAPVHQDFAAAVRALGHEFRIVTTRTGADAPGEEAIGDVLPTASAWRRADALGAPWLRTRSVLSPAAALANHLGAAGDHVDLLHVEVAYPFGTAAVLGATAARWAGPIALTPMGEDTLRVDALQYGFRRHAIPRWLIDWTLRRAAGLRCISPLHERAIGRLAPGSPRRVVPLNVTTAVVAASIESATEREARRRAARERVDAEFGTAGRPVALSLGRLHPFKCIDQLIGAMRLLPDVVLLIAGPSLHLKSSGDEATRLSRLIDTWDLGARVHMLGAVRSTRAMDLLAAANVVAVPSRLESLNKVCVEAVAVGTPFVVTETTGISAWARSLGVGYVVRPDDEEALAQAITTAIRQGVVPTSQIATFVGVFSPASVAADVLDFYHALLAERAPVR